jgi:hypothetical protein
MRLLTLLTVVLMTTTFAYAQDNIVLRNGEEIPAKVLEVNQTDLKYRKSANPDGPIYTAPLRDVLLIKYANGTKDSFGADRGVTRPMPGRPDAPMLMDRGAGRPTRGRQGPPTLMDAGPTMGMGRLRYHKSLFSRYYSSADGQRISLSQTRSVMYTNPDAMTSFDRGRSLRTWSIVTAVPAVALIGAGVGVMVAGSSRDGRDGNGRLDPFGGRNNDPNMNGTNNRFGRGDRMAAGAVLAGSGVLLGAASLWLDHRATVQFRRAADRYNARPSTSLQFRPSSQSVGLGAALTF